MTCHSRWMSAGFGLYVRTVICLLIEFGFLWHGPRDGPAARLFALLPKATKGLAVTVVAAPRGERTKVRFTLDAGGASPAGRIIAVRVSRPDGSEESAYRSFVTLAAAEGEAEVPLALNDPPGLWKVTCTDVATRVKGEAKFEVK